MSDNESEISKTSDIPDTQPESKKPKKLGKLSKQVDNDKLKKEKTNTKPLKLETSNSDDEGETIYSEERSDDDESIGSLVDFIVEEESKSPKSPKVIEMEEDETNLLLQDAKLFLGNENLELTSKVKNGRVLRGNPKTTETQRQYWTRRIVYLQCLDDLGSKAWKNRAKELSIPNLKQNIPEKVDINGNITDDKWNEFTIFYNELKEKLFGEDSESSCDEEDEDFSDTDELIHELDDEDDEDEEGDDEDDNEDEDEESDDEDDEDESDEEKEDNEDE